MWKHGAGWCLINRFSGFGDWDIVITGDINREKREWKNLKSWRGSLKLTNHGIAHYLWSTDLSKSFSQLIVSIFTFLNQLLIIFSQYFFNRFKVIPHCLYRDSLTLRKFLKQLKYLKPLWDQEKGSKNLVWKISRRETNFHTVKISELTCGKFYLS